MLWGSLELDYRSGIGDEMITLVVRRSVGPIVWALGVATIVFLIVHSILSPGTTGSGPFATVLGTVATCLAIVGLTLGGLLFRAYSQDSLLQDLISSKGAIFGFRARLDSTSYRALSANLPGSMFRFAASGELNVLITNAGVEFFWPLRTSEQRIFFVPINDVVGAFKGPKRSFFRGDLILDTSTEVGRLHLRVSRYRLRARGGVERVITSLH